MVCYDPKETFCSQKFLGTRLQNEQIAGSVEARVVGLPFATKLNVICAVKGDVKHLAERARSNFNVAHVFALPKSRNRDDLQDCLGVWGGHFGEFVESILFPDQKNHS